MHDAAAVNVRERAQQAGTDVRGGGGRQRHAAGREQRAQREAGSAVGEHRLEPEANIVGVVRCAEQPHNVRRSAVADRLQGGLLLLSGANIFGEGQQRPFRALQRRRAVGEEDDLGQRASAEERASISLALEGECERAAL